MLIVGGYKGGEGLYYFYQQGSTGFILHGQPHSAPIPPTNELYNINGDFTKPTNTNEYLK